MKGIMHGCLNELIDSGYYLFMINFLELYYKEGFNNPIIKKCMMKIYLK